MNRKSIMLPELLNNRIIQFIGDSKISKQRFITLIFDYMDDMDITLTDLILEYQIFNLEQKLLILKDKKKSK